MTPQDHDTFAKMLLAVGELYGKQVSPTTISLYFKSLIEYDIKDIGRAFNLHVKNPDNGQFFPKPADLVRMLEGNTENQGMLAWVKVREAIGMAGPWRSVTFDDPIIHLVLFDMGGWPKLCDMTADEEPFVAKEFEKRYRAYRVKGRPEKFPSHLPGLAEKQNSGRFAHKEPVMLIGVKENANAVLRLGHDQSCRPAVNMAHIGDNLPKLSNK